MAPRRFNQETRARIIEQYRDGQSLVSLAKTFQCVIATINRVLWEGGIKKPPGHRRPKYLPTSEEIESRAAEIRKNWDQGTHRQRAGLPKRKVPYTVPVYHISSNRSNEIVMDRVG